MNRFIFFAPSIPNEWRLIPNKYLFQSHSSKVGKAYSNYSLLSLTTRGVAIKNINSKGGKLPESFEGYQTVEPGDMIFCLFDLDMSAVFSGLSNYGGMITSAYEVFKVNKDYLTPTYAKYWFEYVFSGRYYKNFSKNIRYTIGSDAFGQIITPCPNLEEQKAIADFLTKKTSTIDQLISNQEKQIEKLKEYRQAIITKAVTKGLNPNVPMKDSGIEWIGGIPNNVNVSSVKNFYNITLGKMLQPKQENENDTLEYYFCAANLGNNCLKTDDLKQMWFSVKEKEKYSLKKGDLLVVEGGDVASSSIIGTDVSNIYFQNSIHRARPIHGLNEYLHYYLIFVKGSGYFDVNCNKATIMHFTKDKFSNLPFLIRNTEEQKKIVTFLNKEETKINRLISIKEKKIEFLTNYKKSLIYEYVTGEKRVSL